MAGTWTSERFPEFEQALRKLTEQHKELKDEPLYLAISYGPSGEQRDIFLLEVIGGGLEAVANTEREWFEVTFAPTAGFPMEFEQRLHLIIANPQEFENALRDHWPSADDFADAFRAGDYRVLHADKTGKRLLKRIQSVLQARNGAARG